MPYTLYTDPTHRMHTPDHWQCLQVPQQHHSSYYGREPDDLELTEHLCVTHSRCYDQNHFTPQALQHNSFPLAVSFEVFCTQTSLQPPPCSNLLLSPLDLPFRTHFFMPFPLRPTAPNIHPPKKHPVNPNVNPNLNQIDIQFLKPQSTERSLLSRAHEIQNSMCSNSLTLSRSSSATRIKVNNNSSKTQLCSWEQNPVVGKEPSRCPLTKLGCWADPISRERSL